MSRAIGIAMVLIGAVAGAAIAWRTGTEPLPLLINGATILVYLGATETFFSRGGVQTLREIVETPSLRARLVSLLGGALAALTVAGALRLRGAALVPVVTLAGLFILLLAVEVVYARSRTWRSVREAITVDPRAKFLAYLAAACAVVTAMSVVQRRAAYLLPMAVVAIVAGAFFVLDRLLARSRVWAVARQMIREGLRMKIALVFIVVLLVVLPILPFTVQGDGATLTSRIQMFLSFSLTAVTFLLSLLTIFLACASLSTEVRDKQIHMVATKPIPRWQFLVGKCVGIVALNLVLLAGCGFMIYGFARWYLQDLPPLNTLDAYNVTNEVFTARAGAALTPPPLPVEDRIRQLQSEGQLRLGPDVDGQTEQNVRREIQRQLESDYMSVPPGQWRRYEFKNVLVDSSSNALLHIRFKPGPGGMPQNDVWSLLWDFGDPNLGTNWVRRVLPFPNGRWNTVEFPANCVSDEGVLVVHLANLDPGGTISFHGDEAGFELLYTIGRWGPNFVRALGLVFFRLVFLAALGLLMSSFLSFPVACMASLLVFFVAIGAGFLHDAIGFTTPSHSSDDLFGVLGVPIRAMAAGFLWVVPDLSKFNPIPTFVDGRDVTLMWIIQGALHLVVVRTLLLGFLACVIFTRRELAQVIV